MRIPKREISPSMPLTLGGSVEYVRRCEDDSIRWLAREGVELVPTCLRCPDAPCVRFSVEELESASYTMSFDRNPVVCPFDALAIDRQSATPHIKENCVGCGLCAARCPAGAIAIVQGHAAVSLADNGYTAPSIEIESHIDTRRRIASLIASSSRPGKPDWAARRSSAQRTLSAVDAARDSRTTMGLLVRNALMACGAAAKLGVPGDTNSRLDLSFDMDGKVGIVELEQGPDLLDSARRLLSDVATARARHGIPRDAILPVIVCRQMPNKRTDFYRLADDAENVLGLLISTIPLAVLVLMVLARHDAVDLRLPELFHAGAADPSMLEDAAELFLTSENFLKGLGVSPAK